MGKHVCPICEDVYAIAARADVVIGERNETVEAWNCPRCDYEFVSVADLRRLLEVADSAPVTVATHLLAPSVVRWRENALGNPSVTASA
jgi:hypothetical protein